MINQLDSSKFILQTIYKNIQIANLIRYYTQTPLPLIFSEFNSGSLENEEIKIKEKDVCNNIQDKSLSTTCDEEKEKFLVRKESDYFVSTKSLNLVFTSAFVNSSKHITGCSSFSFVPKINLSISAIIFKLSYS